MRNEINQMIKFYAALILGGIFDGWAFCPVIK